MAVVMAILSQAVEVPIQAVLVRYKGVEYVLPETPDVLRLISAISKAELPGEITPPVVEAPTD